MKNIAIALLLITSFQGSYSFATPAAHPPSAFNDFNMSGPSEYTESCNRLYSAVEAAYKNISESHPPYTLDGLFKDYNLLMRLYQKGQFVSNVLFNTHPKESIRKVATECEQKFKAFDTSLRLNRNLYNKLAAINLKDASASDRHAVERELLSFRLMGVEKNEETREKIRVLNEKIVQIAQEFAQNIANGQGYVDFNSVEDLEGMPEDFIKNHPANSDGKIRVTTRYPDYFPVMTYARKEETRKKLSQVYLNRAYPANEEVLKKLLKSRYELAQLMGYSNFATLSQLDKMVQNPKNAQEFIDKVSRLTTKGQAREMALLLDLKRVDVPGATQVNQWDRYYYENIYKKNNFNVSEEEVRKYFVFEKVKEGVIGFTSQFFKIRFSKVEGLNLWHSSVEAYDVYDKASKDAYLGRIYLDLHPRENKFSHAAMMPISSGTNQGTIAEAALVCNFPGPSQEGAPALLQFDEVSTFFHEFGHLVHQLLASKGKWYSTAGISTEWDFVEAPSQFLEEWTFEYDVLKNFAKHYQTGETIPKDLVLRLKAAHEFGKAIHTGRQLWLAAMSLHFYNRNPEGLDLIHETVALLKKYSVLPHMEGTHFYAAFGHLDEYSSNYYTYMWSDVLSRDMLSYFKTKGMMNVVAASRYRGMVLEPGGSKPAAKLVRDFLGRHYNFNAFKQWLEAPLPKAAP